MDPVAHSLVGASLAATGLGRLTRFGTATLVVGANLPDVDAITYALGADASLLLRRGWTHGVLAMATFPFLLAGIMLLVDRARPGPGRSSRPPGRLGPLLLLAVISVWSHPALDLLNTYGIRLLMPFDGRWFYGDTLFIADPWFWLLAGAGAVASFRDGWLRSGGWLALGALGTAFVALAPTSSSTTVVVWLLAVSGVAIVAGRRLDGHGGARIAIAGLVTLVVYIAVMRIGSVSAREQARAWLAARDIVPLTLMAGPIAVDPLRRDVIVGLADRYEFLVVDLLRGDVRQGRAPLARGDHDPAVAAALAHPAARGFRTWRRYPSYNVAAEPSGVRVLMRDVRYAREGTRGFAIAEILLPPE